MSSVRTCLFELLLILYFRYLGKMKAEVQNIRWLYEESEEAGETATLTLSTSGGKSNMKLQLQSSLRTSPPSRSTPAAKPVPGKCPPSIWTALHHLPHHHHHQDFPLWVCGLPYVKPTATSTAWIVEGVRGSASLTMVATAHRTKMTLETAV